MTNVQDRNSEFIGNLIQDFWTRRDSVIGQANGIALALNTHFLRAFWPYSVSRVGGAIADISTNGYDLTRSGAGVAMSSLSMSLTPICTFDGASQLSRAHGTEWIHGGPFTEGGWIYSTGFAATRGIIGKYRDDGANERSHLMFTTAAGVLTGRVSSDGINNVDIPGPTLSLTQWYHCVFRFTPSTELALFVNGRKLASLTIGVPAGFYTGGARAFVVGAYNNTPGYFGGSMGYTFYCTASISDGQIFTLFEGTRAAFGI